MITCSALYFSDYYLTTNIVLCHVVQNKFNFCFLNTSLIKFYIIYLYYVNITFILLYYLQSNVHLYNDADALKTLAGSMLTANKSKSRWCETKWFCFNESMSDSKKIIRLVDYENKTRNALGVKCQGDYQIILNSCEENGLSNVNVLVETPPRFTISYCYCLLY